MNFWLFSVFLWKQILGWVFVVNKQTLPFPLCGFKMKHTNFDPSASKKKIENAGVNSNTKKAQKQVEDNFMAFVKQRIGDKYEEIFADLSIMEAMLVEFFETFRLNDNRLPSRSTLNSYKSHIRGMVLRITKNKVNITDAISFPTFSRLWKAKILELKQNGRGDTQHNMPIPDIVMDKLYRLLSIITKLM